MRKRFQLTLFASLSALALGCFGSVEQAETTSDDSVVELASTSQALTSPGYSMVAWEDFSTAANPPPGSSLADLKANLPALQGRGVALVLHWRAENLNDSARWQIVDDARARGIPVYPWLTLREGSAAENEPQSANYAKTGYFPNDTNYVEWIAQAKALMTLWTGRGYAPTTFVVDLEMRKSRLLRFEQMTNDGTPTSQVITFLRQGINRSRHANAISAFKSYVSYAHARSFKVSATVLLPMLDDYGDDDDDLRQAFNVPIENFPNASGAIAWDEVSFQVQRTFYQHTFPQLTSYFVQDYALLARIVFGSKAGVGLGLTHRGISGVAPEYANGNELRLDVQAALQSGIPTSKIGVYSFYGMYRPSSAPVSQWFQAPQSRPALWPDLQTGLVHASFFVVDGLLDGS